MKAWIALILWVLPLFGQENTLTIWPDQDRKPVFTDITATDTLTHDFLFSRRSDRHGYAGFGAYYAWTDTASGGAGARDSLLINAYPLVYDEIDGQYEIGTTALFTTGKDSVNIANYIDWGANHSDDKYTISKVLNLQNCDGVRVVISNVGAALKFRDEIKFSNSK